MINIIVGKRYFCDSLTFTLSSNKCLLLKMKKKHSYIKQKKVFVDPILIDYNWDILPVLNYMFHMLLHDHMD
jgi:hypothetical protein